MKKINNKFKIILIIIIGIIIVSSVSVYATYNYFAKDIKYTKTDGTEISVENALNELYQKKNRGTLIWENSNIKSSFEPSTLNFDFSQYDYVLVIGYQTTSPTTPVNTLVKVPSENYNLGFYGINYGRSFELYSDKIVFGRGQEVNKVYNNSYGIPYQIYGFKNLVY